MTPIEWTDETWNPTRGCSMAKGSENGGCLNCYAARNQLRRPHQTAAASGNPFSIMRESGPRWSGEVELIESKLEEPLHWKAPRRVFVNSMSDLFHEALPDGAIDRVFAVMALCPQHTFQILTKRAERMMKWACDVSRERFGKDTPSRIQNSIIQDIGVIAGVHYPLRNVWLGVSVEDRANKYRIDLLRETPATVRFLSIEPLLEDIGELNLAGIHQVIVGGESGPCARPCEVEWVRSTVKQCRLANVACFVKQLGSRPVGTNEDLGKWRARARIDKKAGNWELWPEDLRVRQFPLSKAPAKAEARA